MKKWHVGMIGSGIGIGQKLEGIEYAPYYLRSRHLVDHLCDHKIAVNDYGDVNVHVKDIFESYERLSNLCRRSSLRNQFTAIFGGDHSHSIGSIFGLKKQNPQLKVLWIDAHGDINTPKTSPSGNLHGMPLAALLGLFDLNRVGHMDWFHPVLQPSDVALLGVRDLDSGEKEVIENLKLPCFDVEEIRDIGMASALDIILDRMDPQGTSPFHLSIDVDCLDGSEVKATGLPVPKGFFRNELEQFVTQIQKKRKVTSIEVVEFNPNLAMEDQQWVPIADFIADLFRLVIANELRRFLNTQDPTKVYNKNIPSQQAAVLV
ncbi:MAG: arginase [Bdellovibrionales bacterium]|nr:arginase [Bdellovibrionales bacterium]